MLKIQNMFLILILALSYILSAKLKQDQSLFLTCPSGQYLTRHSNEYSNLVCCPNDRGAVPYKPSAQILCCLKGVGTEPFAKGCSRGGNILPIRPSSVPTKKEGSITGSCPDGWIVTRDLANVSEGLVCCPKGRSGVIYKPNSQVACCLPGVGTEAFAKGCSRGGTVWSRGLTIQ
jgi:hypothetical protein